MFQCEYIPCNLLDETYQLLRNLNQLPGWVSLFELKSYRKMMNNQFDFKLSEKGAGRTVTDVILEDLNIKTTNLRDGQLVEYKISMDGASCANDRSIKQINITK